MWFNRCDDKQQEDSYDEESPRRAADPPAFSASSEVATKFNDDAYVGGIYRGDFSGAQKQQKQQEQRPAAGFNLVLMVNELMRSSDEKTLVEYKRGKRVPDPDDALLAIYEEEKKAAQSGGAAFVPDEETTRTVANTAEYTADGSGIHILVGGGPGSVGKESSRAEDQISYSDPFAKRMGKTLTWTEVNMELTAKDDKPSRKLLDNVWGEVPKKETTAIMGPSGAGKSSLLNILSGRAGSGGKIAIRADVRLNNYSVDPRDIQVRKMIAFVAQDDSLQITATPREAIRFSARLRLPRDTSDEEIDELTERMLSELGLTSCADTLVGGPLLKGISGGERKRTSVGVELVVKPAMVFLDEPTSGLDSFSAVQLCEVLRKVANAGASVLFTIHQPSSEIFQSFDHLILLNKGRVMYQGSVRGVPDYFGERGHPCPSNYNPADWIMNVAQSTPLEELVQLGYFPEDDREQVEPFLPGPGKDALGRTLHGRQAGGIEPQPGFRQQVSMLFIRELAHMRRDKSNVATRMIISTVLSVLIGNIFFEVGESSLTDIDTVRSHFGSLVIVFLFAMLGAAQPALLAFPDERPVFLREYSTNHYTVGAYFFARLSMEALVTGVQTTCMMGIMYNMIKFIGDYWLLYLDLYLLSMTSTALAVLVGCAAGGNSKLAIQMLPLIFLPQALFAGFFVAPELIPAWLRWLQYIMPLTYGIRIAVLEEFGGCGGESFTFYCDSVIDSVQANDVKEWVYWFNMGLMFIVVRLLGLYILEKNARRFY